MNRLFLLLEFLHGQKHAQPILADMIEEEGNSFLAERVRSRKQSGRKLLQLALEVLPFQMGAEIGIDYVEHAISHGHTNDQLNVLMAEARKWIQTLTDKEAVHDFQLSNLDFGQGEPGRSLGANIDAIDHAFAELKEMLTAVERAAIAEDEGDSERVRRSNNRMRNALVKLAGYCREIPFGIMNRLHPNRLYPYQELVRHREPGQMDWQWNHLIEVIEQSVNEDDF